MTVSNHLWWQKPVFYQLYPRSFADGNGDGIGGFPGMIDRLGAHRRDIRVILDLVLNHT